MTEAEFTELVDLYAAGELPPALTAFVQARLAADAEAARDAGTLQKAVALLQDAPQVSPSERFTERLLETLLRDQAGAQTFIINQF